MKIENLKELQKVIALCRKLNVEAMEIGDIRFNLGPAPTKPTRQRHVIDFSEANIVIPRPNIIDPTIQETVQETIKTDELSEEALLFYSSRDETISES